MPQLRERWRKSRCSPEWGPVSDRELILFQFSRDKVERGDFTAFLSRFGTDRLPMGPALARMMGSMAFMVEGYDHDPREIYAIPEVRRFYAAFHTAWPYWLYFCNFDQDNFKTIAMCCLTSLTSIARTGSTNVGVHLDPKELLRFIAADFGPLNARCERAGLSERALYDRTKEILEYFDFPFDVPPP